MPPTSVVMAGLGSIIYILLTRGLKEDVETGTGPGMMGVRGNLWTKTGRPGLP